MNNNNMVIGGRIGNKDIATDGINNFVQSMKEFEWTGNTIYKPAKVCDIRPTFVKSQGGSGTSGDHYQPKQINFDLFYIEENKYLANFQQYKSDIEDRKMQFLDKIETKKKDFAVSYFPNDLKDSDDKKTIIAQLKVSKSKVIQNSNLSSKLGNYLNHLNSQQNFNNNFNYNYQK
jgi:hypothetical protein